MFYEGYENLIIVICIFYLVYRMHGTEKAKNQRERLNRSLDVQNDWDDYVAKLCRITGKNAGELFHIAAEESNLHYSDQVIGNHFKTFIDTGEVPRYVEVFLEKGKDKIDSINV